MAGYSKKHRLEIENPVQLRCGGPGFYPLHLA